MSWLEIQENLADCLCLSISHNAAINVAARAAATSRVNWEELFPSRHTWLLALRRSVSKLTHIALDRAHKICFQAHSCGILHRAALGHETYFPQNWQGIRERESTRDRSHRLFITQLQK